MAPQTKPYAPLGSDFDVRNQRREPVALAEEPTNRPPANANQASYERMFHMPAGSLARSGTFVERIPNVMRKKASANLAAWLMEWWLTHTEFVFDYLKPATMAKRVLTVSDLRAWQFTRNYDVGKFRAACWTGSADVRRELYRKIKPLFTGPRPVRVTFPTPPLSSGPGDAAQVAQPVASAADRNDLDWAAEVVKWQTAEIQDGASARDLAMAWNFDDLGLALGRYRWVLLPKGSARCPPENPRYESDNNVVAVTIEEIGVIAEDSFDFNGPQELGAFNADPGAEDISANPLRVFALTDWLSSDAGFYVDRRTGRSVMGWQRVKNESFQRYRKETRLGHDFMVYSNLVFEPGPPAAADSTKFFRLDTLEELPP